MEVPTIDVAPDEREDNIRMVRDSAADVLRDDLTRNRALRFGPRGHDPARLKEFAALGWTMLRLPEERGGLGLGLAGLAAVAEELGRVLSPEPVIAMALTAALLPDEAILAGTRIVLPAFAPFGGEQPRLAGDRVTGQAEPVLLGAVADAWLVQTDGGAVLVEAGAPGVSVEAMASHDGGHLAALRFSDAPAARVAGDVEGLREEAALALSAYLLGLAERAFDITGTYLKDRRQFERPIGSFQVLQHRMVDLYLEIALARAAVEQAAEFADRRPEEEAGIRRLVSLARAQAGQAADRVTRAAIQMHGGIGYTDEADIGLFLRKFMVLSGLLGGGRFHWARALQLTETRA